MIHIYPSLMAADQSRLKEEIELLEPHCAGFHLDIMDNQFVPNIALSIDTVNMIAQRSKPVWVHLMVEKPDTFYMQLFLPRDSIVSFHLESKIDIVSFTKIIKEKKHKVSIAINPKTPVKRIVPFLNIVDHILVMTVNPGFSGQPFLQSSFEKLMELVTYRQQQNNFFRIGLDGGIDKTNIKKLIEIGADDFAIGSAFFKQEDRVAALQEFEQACEKIER